MRQRLRTSITKEKYEQYILERSTDDTCVLCNKPSLKSFVHWKIITNDFPYDRIAEVHEMIVPLRHVTEKQLTEDELSEYSKIKERDLQDYEFLLEATIKTKSIPEHFHIHCITIKELE